MGKKPPKWLPGERVNETILLQRKTVEQLRADRYLRRDKLQERRDRHKSKIDAKRNRKLSTKKFISAQTILKYAQRSQHQKQKFHKLGEKVSGKLFRLEPVQKDEKYRLENRKIVLIVRAKGNLIPREVANAFRKLGLDKLYKARLLLLDSHGDKLTQQLAPFSILGSPSAAALETLVRTRGCLWNKVTKTRKVISGNLLLEQALGEYNILCIEDLVNALLQRAPDVEKILRHIAPFDFHPPHHLYLERHRSVHQKLEIVNPDSFAAYLTEQLASSTIQPQKQKRVGEKRPRQVVEEEKMET